MQTKSQGSLKGEAMGHSRRWEVSQEGRQGLLRNAPAICWHLWQVLSRNDNQGQRGHREVSCPARDAQDPLQWGELTEDRKSSETCQQLGTNAWAWNGTKESLSPVWSNVCKSCAQSRERKTSSSGTGYEIVNVRPVWDLISTETNPMILSLNGVGGVESWTFLSATY